MLQRATGGAQEPAYTDPAWGPPPGTTDSHGHRAGTTQINSEWAEDLNLKTYNCRFLEETIGVNLCDLGFFNGFSDMTKQVN